ncbi:MAG: helix-turn-helix domain-containing protein [Mariprofundaceae bacterium]|nr:helix-turn-helix domain-containing protein [Mariprofundaceae bacterium]
MFQDSPAANCPIEGLLNTLQDRWAFLILRDAFYGVRRFDGFRQHLGISRKILSARLNRMVQEGIFSRTPYQQQPVRHEYILTGKGRDLFPLLLTMIRWGNRWLAEPDMPVLEIRHIACGEITEPTVVCNYCREMLTPARVRPVAGPGAKMEAVEALKGAVRKSTRPKRTHHD